MSETKQNQENLASYNNLNKTQEELISFFKGNFELTKNSENISKLDVSNHDIVYLSMIFERIKANQSTNTDIIDLKKSIIN